MKFLNWLFSWRDSKEQPRTEIVRGDLLELATGNNFDVIIHGCNCFHSMSGGIARAIAKKWPSAETADAMTPKGDKFKLGTYSTAVVEGKEDYAPYEVMIINAYTQYNPGADVNYEAIRDVFKRLHQDLPKDIEIGIPRIGAGIAGGDWQTIEDIILTEMPGRFITIVAFIP